MRRLPTRAELVDDFDRIALAQRDRDERLDAYESELLEQVPAPCGAALDVGCGIGVLSRALALRAEVVDAIDLSPQMLALARERTTPGRVRYHRLDLLADPLPRRDYDCVIGVAMLHHVPLEAGLEAMRAAVAPGGRLLVLDVFRSHGLRDRALDVGAALVSAPRRFRHGFDRQRAAAWRAHAEHEELPTLEQVRRAAERVLPGARIRRRLRWRYELSWRAGPVGV